MNTFRFLNSSVNILLPNPTSDAFLECLSLYSNPFKLISISDNSELPENHLWKGALGVSLPVQDGIVPIFVDMSKLQEEGFPDECWEVIAGHELLHKWLGVNGYPVVVPGKHFTSEPKVQEIADRLVSLSQHPLIKQKLSNTKLQTYATYKIIGTLHIEHVSKLLTDNKITNLRKGTPVYTLVILECLELYLIHPDYEEECDSLLSALDTQHLQTIKACLKDQEKLYGNPRDILDTLRHWKLLLNIEDKVSIFDTVKKQWH